MNLERTLKLARLEVITDRTYFYGIIKELFDTPLSVLESVSPSFSLAAVYSAEDMVERNSGELTFRDIVQLPQEYWKNGNYHQALRLLQYIACGLTAANSILSVRTFLMISVKSLAEAVSYKKFLELWDMVEMYMVSDLMPEITLGGFLKEIVKDISSPWDVETDFDYYREIITEVTSIIGIVLDSALYIDRNHTR